MHVIPAAPDVALPLSAVQMHSVLLWLPCKLLIGSAASALAARDSSVLQAGPASSTGDWAGPARQFDWSQAGLVQEKHQLVSPEWLDQAAWALSAARSHLTKSSSDSLR